MPFPKPFAAWAWTEAALKSGRVERFECQSLRDAKLWLCDLFGKEPTVEHYGIDHGPWSLFISSPIDVEKCVDLRNTISATMGRAVLRGY